MGDSGSLSLGHIISFLMIHLSTVDVSPHVVLRLQHGVCLYHDAGAAARRGESGGSQTEKQAESVLFPTRATSTINC